MDLMSLLLIRNLSGEVHAIPNDIFVDAAYVRMSVGPYKIIYFKFVVYHNMTHTIDVIILIIVLVTYYINL